MSIEFDELDKARESADDKQGLFQISILKLPIRWMCACVCVLKCLAHLFELHELRETDDFHHFSIFYPQCVNYSLSCIICPLYFIDIFCHCFCSFG